MMVHYINKYPGKVNILALGPLTNLALAYMLDRNIPGKIKDVVTMGGSYLQRGNANATAEFNYYHDYLACYIFFRSFKLDFIFIDGNHREEATINYFKQLLPLIHNDSLMVFDDVHWSKGMENAWHSMP